MIVTILLTDNNLYIFLTLNLGLSDSNDLDYLLPLRKKYEGDELGSPPYLVQ